MSDEEMEWYEAMSDLALENAHLLDWCERNGWGIEDTGGGCSALLKKTGPGTFSRITLTNDPSMPQTFSDAIRVGQYDENDRQKSGLTATYHGGIDEMLQSGE